MILAPVATSIPNWPINIAAIFFPIEYRLRLLLASLTPRPEPLASAWFQP
jgi:hypothetical protein